MPASASSSAPSARQLFLAAALLLLTLFTTTTLGAVWTVATHTETTTSLVMWLDATTVRGVWNNPELLTAGLMFSLPLLFILLCHELGHYVPCRRFNLRSTPPYFLPMPIALGTFGAFIKIGSPIRSRKELLIVGAGGPIAGFAALLPFLVVGIALSEPASFRPVDVDAAEATLFLPGRSLASAAVTYLIHGPLPVDTTLNLHPFALAAWVGLLATALNLLPLAQLDGGHILYAMFGRLQHRLAWPLWIALALSSLLWPGWAIWCAVIWYIGPKHPPVENESVRLDSFYQWVGWLALAIFLVSFMPVPLESLFVAS